MRRREEMLGERVGSEELWITKKTSQEKGGRTRATHRGGLDHDDRRQHHGPNKKGFGLRRNTSLYWNKMRDYSILSHYMSVLHEL